MVTYVVLLQSFVQPKPIASFLQSTTSSHSAIQLINNQWTEPSPCPIFLNDNPFHLDVRNNMEEEICSICSICFPFTLTLQSRRYSWDIIHEIHLWCVFIPVISVVFTVSVTYVLQVWSHHCRKTYSRTERIEEQFHKWFILVLMNKEKDKRGSKKDKRENNCELYHWPLKPSAKYWTESLKFS